jgi:hypothetical protein
MTMAVLVISIPSHMVWDHLPEEQKPQRVKERIEQSQIEGACRKQGGRDEATSSFI